MRSALRLRALAPLALSLLLLAPVAPTTPSAVAADDDRVPTFRVKPFDPAYQQRAWRRWQAQDAQHYVITVERSCFCPDRPPIRTEVDDGRLVSVTTVEDVPRRLEARNGHSMDEMFHLLRTMRRADRVAVVFSRRGVPRAIAIDPDQPVADEEVYYRVSVRIVS